MEGKLEKLYVVGGNKLEGDVKISGSKNVTLALMAAALLANGVVTLRNIPRIGDVFTMVDMLRQLGVRTKINGENIVEIDASNISKCEAKYELVKKMRASFSVAGPLLARKGYAKIPIPGGCEIGARPIDFHIKGLRKLGAVVNLEHGYVEAEAKKLTGAYISLDFPSDGTTQHLITAACLAEGKTTIHGASAVPEVVELSRMLNSMGAKISGAGTQVIVIEGVKELQGVDHTVSSDRLETGTFAIAAAITNGDVRLIDAIPENCTSTFGKLIEAGVKIDVMPGYVRVRNNGRPNSVNIKTLPYPGFPTDMQQPFGAFMSIAKGTSIISENVFENRFKYVGELMRMGADITIDGRTAIVKGVPKLTGAEVAATDLRAGAALVIAGLVAEGRTEISGVDHIDRGYEKLIEKLSAINASIVRINDDEKHDIRWFRINL